MIIALFNLLLIETYILKFEMSQKYVLPEPHKKCPFNIETLVQQSCSFTTSLQGLNDLIPLKKYHNRLVKHYQFHLMLSFSKIIKENGFQNLHKEFS